MQKKKKRRKKKKISFQKIFSFISFIFILTCILWYGGRAVYFYLDNKKIIKNEDNVLAMAVIGGNNQSRNFKLIGTDHYFSGAVTNNYVEYSNMLWRIVKITKDNNIVLVLDDSITNLAYGKNKKYKNSYPMKWLNTDKDENTGILEKSLNDKNKYLIKTQTCIDNVNNIKKITCDKIDNNYYLSMLSLKDYINTGGKDGFINNNKNTYLANSKKDKIWYINDGGAIDTSVGEDIFGIKPVITLKKNVKLISGNGNNNNPYKIEKKTSIFGSYVKLDEDIWRVYSSDNGSLKLVLNDYLRINEEKLEYNYSKTNYLHNDTVFGSLAYYLNHRYLNSLSYNDLILDSKFNNGYYGDDNSFNYFENMSNKIDTKVGLLSIGDPIINNTLDNYFLLTGVGKESEEVYVASNTSTLETALATDNAYVVPTITIDKNILTQGSGSNSDPYRTE